MFTVTRKELLSLFDVEAGKEVAPSPLTETVGSTASALNALLGEDIVLAIFCHYWNNCEQSGGTASVASFDCRERKGKWLDAWVRIDGSGSKKLFRTEVKNWTAHSRGGHYTLPIDAPNEDVLRRAKQQWTRWIDDAKNRPRIEKVRACSPKPLEGFDASEALLCFWGPISPHDESELSPFLKIRYPEHYLSDVNIFSASIYLRLIKDLQLAVELPRVERRIERLRSLGVLR